MGATAQKILAAGNELLQTRGYHAFSYRDLAARLNIKSASIHYHFPAKQDLALAIAETVFEAFESQTKTIQMTQSSLCGQLRAFAQIFATTFGDGDRLCPICMLAVCQESVPEALQVRVRDFWTWSESWLTAVFQQAMLQGELPSTLDAPAAARTWISALEGSLLTARSFRDPRRVLETSEFLLRWVVGAEAARLGSP